MKNNRQKMVRVQHKTETTPYAHGNPNKKWKPVKLVRRDSESEILQRQVLRHGVIRLRVSLSIYDKDVFNYAAWRECNLFVDCPDVETAKAFRREMENGVADAGQSLGLEVKVTKTLESKNGNPRK